MTVIQKQQQEDQLGLCMDYPPGISACTANCEWHVALFVTLCFHRDWLRTRDVRGRIYITTQGINAQYSGPQKDAHEYALWVGQQPGFKVGKRVRESYNIMPAISQAYWPLMLIMKEAMLTLFLDTRVRLLGLLSGAKVELRPSRWS